ncbi:MAG: arylesterase [Alphaproteobacteria bacterium]|nr:arylesterase [Alphaproteobacteria bacterium]
MARVWLVNALAAIFLTLAPGDPAALAAQKTERDLRIVLLGDSLAAGYGVAAGATLPEQLEAALRARGHRVRVINAGVSGDTTAGGRARIGWILRDRPDGVIVELGGNDALRGIEPQATRRNLDAILTRLAEARVPALLAGWKSPRNLGPEYVREFEAVYPELAAKHGVVYYPFILEGVALDPALNQQDGIHPNAKGVARMVEGILPHVERLIARIERRAGRPAL